MSVCNASKVTRRIIWARDLGRTGSTSTYSSPRHNRIMDDSEIKDSDRFKAACSQEETRLRNLHPTPEDIPSCMSAFDDFLSCNSTPDASPHLCPLPGALTQLLESLVLGTQLRSIYRFGEMARCSGKWNEFKFCMSVKGLHPEQRRDAWIQRRAEWWARRRLGLSSENVWEMRAYVPCLITTTVLTECFQRTIEELPTANTPARAHGGSCRIDFNLWANLQLGQLSPTLGIAHSCFRGIEVLGIDIYDATSHTPYKRTGECLAWGDLLMSVD